LIEGENGEEQEQRRKGEDRQSGMSFCFNLNYN